MGAAAFSAGCTQTISTAIAVLEMTGELDFAIPMLLAVILSVLVSSKLGSSIFDRICKLNGLPNIVIPRCDITEKAADEVILWPQALPVNAKLGQIAYCLIRTSSSAEPSAAAAMAALGLTKAYVASLLPFLANRKARCRCDRLEGPLPECPSVLNHELSCCRYTVESCDPQLTADKRDEVVCICEDLPNIQLIGITSRGQLHSLLAEELIRATRETRIALAAGVATRLSPQLSGIQSPERSSLKSGGSTSSLRLTIQRRKLMSSVRKGVSSARDALTSSKFRKDRLVRNLITLLEE